MSELKDTVKRMFGFAGGRRHQQDTEWERKRCDISRHDFKRFGMLALV